MRRRRGIVVTGTDEYSRLTKELKITPEKAKLIVEERKVKDESNLAFRHLFIVDRHYAFVVPKHKLGTAINGYYVDGSSGDIVWVSRLDFQEKFGRRFKNGFISPDELEAIRRVNNRPMQK